MTEEELKAMAEQVNKEAALSIKKQVEEAAAPLKAEIETLKSEKKTLEDKVQKIADLPLGVKTITADFGKYMGCNINEAVEGIRAKGLFKHEITEKGRDNAALCAKFLIAVSKSMITKDNSYYHQFCKDANLEATGAAGGYLVPEVLQAEFIRSARETSFALQKCTVFNMADKKVLFPSEDALPVAYWVDEAGPITQSNPTYGQIAIEAKKAACLTAGVSSELLQDAIVSYVSILAEQMIYSLTQLVDDAVLNGISGNSTDFKGLLVAATAVQGVTLDAGKYMKDVAYDNLVDVVSLLNNEDRAKAEFCFSRYAKGLITKLKDDIGNPIWASAVQGEPATILGQKYFTSEKAPGVSDASTASKIFGVLGDFSKYYIGIRQGSMMIEADPYTNFATDLIRHRMTLRIGGNPVRKSAFAVLKAGADVSTTTTTTTSTTSA